jgi:peptidyl-prolyl cis-trans isomerase SurA
MLNKIMTCRTVLAAAMIFVAADTASIGHAQDAGLTVGDEPITELEIEQRSKYTQFGKRKTPSREEVIDELRNEKLKVQEARKAGLEVSASEVDQAYAEIGRRMRLTPEQMTEHLVQRGVSVDTIKHGIRADIAWKKYLQRSQNPPP